MSFVSFSDLSSILTDIGNKLRRKPTAVRLTQAQYNELTSEQKSDTTKIYYITDGQGGGGGGSNINFSLTESDTGMKWIDGKSIYTKTFYLQNVSTTNTISFGTTIDSPISFFGVVKEEWSNDWAFVPYPNESSISGNICIAHITSTDFQVQLNSSAQAKSNLYVTAFYTKATPVGSI